ncbi:hypothetical protein DL96DRAFT_1611835 [Flagelloscypha sp. PMI_526]|nr:hypothetical protein DL96DRAFT_1611835 [Flagelloscypha sp. PMI_526]
MVAPHLPSELLSVIIDFLHDDREALLACSIVNSACCAFAQPHLFYYIHIHAPAPSPYRQLNLVKRFLQLLTDAPTHCAVGFGSLLHGQDVATILQTLPHVRKLAIRGPTSSFPKSFDEPSSNFMSWDLISGDVRAILHTHTLPKIVSLSLIDIGRIPLYSILYSSRRLRHLRLDSVQSFADTDSEGLAHLSQIPANMRHPLASLDIVGPCGEDLILAVNAGRSKISRLSMGCTGRQLNLPITDVAWESIYKSVVTLEIGRAYFFIMNSGLNARIDYLGSWPVLKSFTLSLSLPAAKRNGTLSMFHECLDSSEADFLLRGIIQLSAPHPLRKLYFRVNLVEEADLGNKWDEWFEAIVLRRPRWDWSHLDGAFLNSNLPNLKEVIFLMPDPRPFGVSRIEAVTRIRAVLPKSHGHGLVKIIFS